MAAATELRRTRVRIACQTERDKLSKQKMPNEPNNEISSNADNKVFVAERQDQVLSACCVDR